MRLIHRVGIVFAAGCALRLLPDLVGSPAWCRVLACPAPIVATRP